jgi:hypothetical protein
VAKTTLNGKEWLKNPPKFLFCLAMDTLGKEDKCKVQPRTGHEGLEGVNSYIYILS